MIDNWACCAKQYLYFQKSINGSYSNCSSTPEDRDYSGVRKTAKLAFFLLNFFNVRSSLAGFLPKLTGQVMTHSLQEK